MWYLSGFLVVRDSRVAKKSHTAINPTALPKALNPKERAFFSRSVPAEFIL
jgi:hypothetical protein